MKYALWSRGRLLGQTELDLDTHQDRFIHGFIETTPLGESVLPDATGVVRVTSRRPPLREGDAATEEYLKDFQVAVDRREALDLSLIDENGDAFEHDFIRVYDLRFQQEFPEPETDDVELADLDEEAAAELKEFEAEIEEDLALRAESRMYGSSWSPPEDERWETMQYYLQVFLKVSEDQLLSSMEP